MRFTLALCFSLVAMPVLADWELSAGQSSLHFVSTKATHVAEVHQFRQLSGSVDDQGQAQLRIDLSSVDTNIPIRDQRMQEMLFEVAKYPNATFSANIDPAVLEMEAGASQQVAISGSLSIHGQSFDITSPAHVERLSPNTIAVSSAAPLVINAKNLGLVEGVEKLREVAGLPSISYSVIVTYDLTFTDN